MNKDKHIPQSYKDSLLGIIPKEWEVKRLGDIAIQIGDGIHGTPEYIDDSDYYFINGNNLCNGKIIITESTRCVSYSEFVKYKKNLTQDTILLSINGTIGNIALYNDENVMLGKSAAFITISNRKYFYYLLQSNRILVGFEKELTGSTIRNLSLDSIRNTKILLPPQTEIEGITKILYLWDTAIEKQSELIEKLTLRKRALMQQLLTGKKRLPGYSEDWKEVKLGKIFIERNETNRSDLPLLSITGDKGVIYQSESDKRDISNDDKSKYKRICPNDIGYNTMRMWQGRSALSQLEGIVSPAYTIVTPTEGIDVRFMAMLIQQPRVVYDFWTHSQGLVSDTLNCKYPDFSQVKVNIPTKKEQTTITDMLYGFDKEIELANGKLINLQSQKRGLMQQLLTGKKRVIE